MDRDFKQGPPSYEAELLTTTRPRSVDKHVSRASVLLRLFTLQPPCNGIPGEITMFRSRQVSASHRFFPLGQM